MNDTVLTVLVVIAVTALLSFFSYKKKQESWEGELVKKNHREDQESGKSTYQLIFKTTEGGKKKLMVNQATFDSFDIGTKVKKSSGEYLPKKN